MNKPVIGILGAGKLGSALGRLSVKAGYETWMAGSSSFDKIALTLKIMVPSALGATAEEVVEKSDVIILALPLSKYTAIPNIKGKLVLDAMNYWWEVDGKDPIPTDPKKTSTALVQEYLKDANVVKAFNHMGYHDLEFETKEKGALDRKAIVYASSSHNEVVEAIINDFGFDSVFIKGIENTKILEPKGALFGANLSKKAIEEVLDNA